MRTTIDISDELFRQAKRKAAEEGIPLREVVDAALRGYLSRRPTRKGYRLRWKTDRGRILPGVDLDDRGSLFDLMDGRK
jgi:hypothetical protein